MRMRMKPTRTVLMLTIVVGLLLPLLGCGPTLLIPGGALPGDDAEAPSDWSFSDEISTIQLETNPADPYSVNIWAIGLGERLYVHSGANRATWIEHMETDPRVRAKVGEQVFALQAERVVSAEEFAIFANAYEKKYGNRPRNENISEVYLYRLTSR
ncbi:MAG: hypothetical protein AB8G23_10770 [Myxococcota bacterium]